MTLHLDKKEFPGRAERLFCCHIMTLVHFMNSSSCIQHLKGQKERALKCYRAGFFSGTDLFLNNRLLLSLLRRGIYFSLLFTSPWTMYSSPAALSQPVRSLGIQQQGKISVSAQRIIQVLL